MNIELRYANLDDLELLKKYDKHIKVEELKQSILANRVLMIYDEKFVGWLRFNLFWDNIPFMNMLYMLDGFRGKGYGKKLMTFWEDEMKAKGYKFVLTSTQSDEQGQFFYRKNGYKDVGSLVLPSEVTEIILYKELQG